MKRAALSDAYAISVKHAYKHNKISWSLLICDKFAHNSKVITQNFPKKVVDRRKSRGVADTRF